MTTKAAAAIAVPLLLLPALFLGCASSFAPAPPASTARVALPGRHSRRGPREFLVNQQHGRVESSNNVECWMFEFGSSIEDSASVSTSRTGVDVAGGWKVPRAAVDSLGRGGEDEQGDFLPFEFELAKGPSAAKKRAVRGSFFFPADTESGADGPSPTESAAMAAPPRLVVRHLVESDLPPAVDMCVEEFGSYSDPQDDPFRRAGATNGDGYVVVNNGDTDMSLGKIFKPLWTRYENWSFSWVVRVGLFMRILRARQGLEGKEPHDHNVLILVETPADAAVAGNKNKEGEVVAMAELSLQPPDPERNAPPYVLPLSAKRAISKRGGFGEPCAYVSNVLVRPDRRGYGYGRAIMAACEGLARCWGWDNVSLHVDADATSGRAAQGLYRSMGYVGVPDERERTNSKLNWMGPEMAQRGLYVVEGLPLLYLRKKLKKQ